MTPQQFEVACRAFCRRRPFRPFLIEFTSGQQLLIGHPEAVGSEAHFCTMRRPDGGHVVFVGDSVARLLDVPVAAQ